MAASEGRAKRNARERQQMRDIVLIVISAGNKVNKTETTKALHQGNTVNKDQTALQFQYHCECKTEHPQLSVKRF